MESIHLRRLRVFTLTASQPVLNRVDHAVCHVAAEVGWRLAEGTASDEAIAGSLDALRVAYEEGCNATRAHFVAPFELWELPRLVNVLALLFSEPGGAARNLIVPLSIVSPGLPVPLLTPEETQGCCWLLRDIFGDRGAVLTSPWWSDMWRTSNVVSLARSMYESRDFSPMPILSDALQDAGCENEDILNHCRSAGPHVRGCWVVDLILGKN